MMKLFGYFILFVLVLNTEAVYRKEVNTHLQNLDNRAHINTRFHWKQKDFYSLSILFSKTKHNTTGEDTQTDDSSSTPIVQDPVRVAIFNAGDYSARIEVNYTFNNQQIEDESSSKIEKGQHRSIFLPKTATSIHIRVRESGIFQKKHIINEQIPDFTDSDSLCYLLAYTSSHPVYGLCPSTYQAMVEAWGTNG